MDGSVQIPFQAKAGGLIVRFESRDVIEKKAATFKALAELIGQHKAKVALVDLTGVPGGSTFLDRYELGESAARFLPRITLAVLVREDQIDRGQIGIMVAANRGMRIELFTNKAAAERWFENSLKPPSPA